ncbi:TPA_asm: DUF551 domain-containing protein [Salmonella enterica subsp. enterica serovar Mbandaka]|uniref:DUF551 domain-containing protein n=1 Tax=Salmonella enterica subsp. enterica serovar Mbandaka TaxID=192954 RepID=A0A6X9B818_SALET|nr:DUF551 domain-containing protein [Salmonella enterica subsp. enterica serovar Mbandaka]
MTTITREQQKQILIDTANHVISRDNTSPYSENLRELARIALASLEAEKGADPVVFTDERNLHHIARGRETSLIWGKQNQEVGDIPLYRHAQPVPVVPEDISGIIERFQYQADHLSEWHHIDEHSCKVNRRDLVTALEFMNSCRAAMLQAEPVSQAYELPEIIEGMEVSIDVSTCDADAGNRYFGTVTEVSELDTAKNGYILLVQDAKPNFDVNGNSPVIPDGWVMVPKELTPEMMRAVQIRSELGGYATSNLSGAYNMFSEFWNVAVSAAPKVDDL